MNDYTKIEARLTGRDGDVHVYRYGIVHCSVCVPEAMPIEELLAEVNSREPLGTTWTVDESPAFAGGQSNPCPCEQTPGRLHRLLVC